MHPVFKLLARKPSNMQTPRVLKVLIACESSGTVRDAFRRLGHVAMSCDILPTDVPGPHYQGDVLDILEQHWDLMVAHPPCTFLSSSGMHWTTRGLRDPKLTEDALDFVRTLLEAPIAKIALENPVGCISTRIRPADQYVHPHQFGDDASKKTGLWLKDLPKLTPTNQIPPRIIQGKERWANQCDSGQNKLGPSDDRWKERSKTYEGLANAIAQQWGGDTGWRHVSFASDCFCPLCADQMCECEDSICSICNKYYSSDCTCPGPTQDGYEYQEFHGELMARQIKTISQEHLA